MIVLAAAACTASHPLDWEHLVLYCVVIVVVGFVLWRVLGD